MFRSILFALLIAIGFLTACNNSSSSEADENTSADMAQFSDDPEFKDAHEDPKAIDFQGKGQMLEFATTDGQTGKGYLVAPGKLTNKVLFVIHEWWGLNDHIKQEAEKLADSLDNVTVLALDLYDGKVADNPDDAGKYMQSANPERIEAIIRGAMGQVGSGAEIATIGWCFGGGWSLKASIIAGEQAAGCVMYYGMPVQEANELAPLQTEVLGIFATKDGWITPEVANNFQKLANSTSKKVTIHQFEADHAFANPSGDRYDQEAAQQANALALAFLREKL